MRFYAGDWDRPEIHWEILGKPRRIAAVDGLWANGMGTGLAYEIRLGKDKNQGRIVYVLADDVGEKVLYVDGFTYRKERSVKQVFKKAKRYENKVQEQRLKKIRL